MVQAPTWALAASDALRYLTLRRWQPRLALDTTLEPLSRRHARLKAAWQASRLSDGRRAGDLNLSIFEAALHRPGRKRRPNDVACDGLIDLGLELALQNDNVFDFPDIDLTRSMTAYEARCVTERLIAVQTRIDHDGRIHDLFVEGLCNIFTTLLNSLPAAAFDADDAPFAVPLYAAIDAVELVDECHSLFLHHLVPETPDAIAALAFETTRLQLWHNLLAISHLTPEQLDSAPHRIVAPKDCNLAPPEMIEAYLGGTPLAAFAATPLPFALPRETRFEHMHIVGGSGHGKTQLLQLLIHEDLKAARYGGPSVVVIDSQGDLIRTISRLAQFAPGAEHSLADRFLLIDPNDVEHPLALNMFDINLERIKGYAPVEREKILNGTIELYEFIFGALLGAELTQKQGVIFRYLARAMMVIPNATIQTLRQLMEDGTPFKVHFQKLEGTARAFFETEFFDPSFSSTKKQILRRLWGVLSNATFERMFSNPRNTVDMFAAMNAGKIILINTAKDLLKREGSEIFGRFFIAMIAQSAIQRAAIPENERRDTLVYIDEAHDYFDDNIEHLLNQARKYRVGLTLAHQNLDQLSTGLRASVMSSTSIKMAGGMSAKDARAMAEDMRSDTDFLHSTHKLDDHTEFACFIKNQTPHAIKLQVPLGLVNELPTLTSDDYDELIGRNRARYSVPLEAVHLEPTAVEASAPSATPSVAAPAPRAVTDAGANATPARQPSEETEHRTLQQLLKTTAQRLSIAATLEAKVLDGRGSVDVALETKDQRIACEVSVTTRPRHERHNVEKCLAAGFDEVWVISRDAMHLQQLQAEIMPSLAADQRLQVSFLSPEAALARIETLAPERPVQHGHHLGYEVVIEHQALEPHERRSRHADLRRLLIDALSKHDVDAGKS